MKRSEKIGKKYSENIYGIKGFERHLLETLRDISETLAMIYDAMAEDPGEVKDL